MKTARFILPIVAGAFLLGPVNAQEPDQLFIYPNEEQSQEQMDKDFSECQMWTYEQVGFPEGYVADDEAGKGKVAKNAAIGTVAGAGVGAAAGSVAGKPGKGAAAGAGAGLVAGLIIGSKKKKKAREEAKEEANAVDSQYNENYRRAMTACMGARGYTVN